MSSDLAWPVAVSTRGAVSAATITWRWRGRAFVTIVARLTFGLGAEGARLEGARPIGADRRRLAMAELAPSLPECDVLVVTPAASSWRLSLARGDELLLATRVSSPPASAPARAGSFPLELASDASFAAYQLAPPDQRVAHLAGGERLRLDGADEALELTIPTVRPELVLVVEGRPVTIEGHLDTLAIDVPERRCTLLFRGQAELAESAIEHARAEVLVVGQAAPPALAGLDATVAMESPPIAEDMGRTLALSPVDAGAPPLPFVSAPPLAARAPSDLLRTALVLDEPEDLPTPLPFAGKASAPPPSSPDEAWLAGGTVAVDVSDIVPAIPFKPAGAPQAEPDEDAATAAARAREAYEEEARAAEEARLARAERERAAVEAARRRDEEAARFAEEQRAAELREGVRLAKEQQAKRQRATTLRQNLYGFKKKS
jgi:hypothetical protein